MLNKTMEGIEISMKLAHMPDMSLPFLTSEPQQALLSQDLQPAQSTKIRSHRDQGVSLQQSRCNNGT